MIHVEQIINLLTWTILFLVYIWKVPFYKVIKSIFSNLSKLLFNEIKRFWICRCNAVICFSTSAEFVSIVVSNSVLPCFICFLYLIAQIKKRSVHGYLIMDWNLIVRLMFLITPGVTWRGWSHCESPDHGILANTISNTQVQHPPFTATRVWSL